MEKMENLLIVVGKFEHDDEWQKKTIIFSDNPLIIIFKFIWLKSNDLY